MTKKEKSDTNRIPIIDELYGFLLLFINFVITPWRKK